MKNIKHYIFLSLSFLFLFSCSKKDAEVQPEKPQYKQGEGQTSSGLKVTLWTDYAALKVAYCPFYISLTDVSGKPVSNANITMQPIMNMTSMTHSSPVEQPTYSAEKALYTGAAVFSMPSGDMGSWKIKVTVNGEAVDVPVVVNPAATNTKYTGTFVGTDGKSYSVSLIQPRASVVGLNDFEVLVNYRETMMSFPPVNDLSIELTPEMPSMGHGSPNNVNPVAKGNGRYLGKVNFTMTGDWRLHLRLKRGNEIIVEDAALDLLF